MGLMMGINSPKEVLNLWYEITYMRYILNYIIEKNPKMDKCINDEVIEQARMMAQNEVNAKFPSIKIDYPKPNANENHPELKS